MVSANPESTGRLADTLESLFHTALDPTQPHRKVALVVVDGLGAQLLADHSGHARFLSSAWRERGWVVDSPLPSTTAAALASVTTGAPPGAHGLLGYQVLDPLTRQLVNHLKEFPPGVDPNTWQPVPTIFERARREGIESVAIAEARFAGSDFTRAILRGATLLGSNSLSSHKAQLRSFFERCDSGVAYIYWPGLDRAGHHRGTRHASWLEQLEAVDEFARDLGATLEPGEYVVFTADHGMVDVAPENHVLVSASHPLRAQVEFWAGEPRCVHLYLFSGFSAEAGCALWQELLGDAATVLCGEDAIARGLFGPVAQSHRNRVGDLVIFAEGAHAIYDELTASSASREMIGQHGSWTAQETLVPVIPLTPGGSD